MSQDHAAQSDVVKKGLLKYKASKVKGTSGASAQGPKSAKSLFVVFRAVHTGDKILHVYSNDKKYHEAENPKYKVYVHDAKSTYFLTDKRSFCISFGDGGLLFFDASSEAEAEEWVRCFNAVLFAKGLSGEGTLQYEVEMLPNSILNYRGAAVLELRDHDLVIWKDNWDEVVRWKLNRLRSFKAKKNTLTILAGSRSVTGLGEFVFNSKHSILITHAIETVVAKVKYTTSPVPPSHSPTQPAREKSHLAPTLPNTIPDMRDPLTSQTLNGTRSSVMANVPDFAPPGVYDVPDGVEEYGKLDHPVGGAGRPAKLGFTQSADPLSYGKKYQNRDRGSRDATPERQLPTPGLFSPHNGDCSPEMYRRLDRSGRAKSPRVSPPVTRTNRTSPPRSNPPPIKPSRPGYEDIDKDFEKEHRRKKSPPIKPSQPGYEDIDKDFEEEENRRKNSPPIKPSRPGYEDIDKDFEAYQRKQENISRNSPLQLPPAKDKPKSPISSKRVLPPKPTPYHPESKAAGHGDLPRTKKASVPSPPHSLNNQQVQEAYGKLNQVPVTEAYGQLNHNVHAPAAQEMYGHLDHTPPPRQDQESCDYDVVDDGIAVHPEQYTKLLHTQFSTSKEDQTTVTRNRLGGSLKTSSSKLENEVVEGYEILQSQTRKKERHTVHHSQKSGNQQEEYGKLNREVGVDTRVHSNDEIAPIPLPRQSSLHPHITAVQDTCTNPEEAYGHLEIPTATARPSFDPYGSLPMDARDRKISVASDCSDEFSTKYGDKIEEESSTLISAYSDREPSNSTSAHIYSTVNKTKVVGHEPRRSKKPPPGYENTKPLDLSRVNATSSPVDASSSPPPIAPPRTGSEKRTRYENVGEDGKVLLHKQPLEDAYHTDGSEQKLAKGSDHIEDLKKIAADYPGTSGQKPTIAPKPKPKPKPKIKS